MKKLLLIIMAVAFSYSASAESKNGIVYVKAGGTGAGTSWSDAKGDIQAAINDAAADFTARKDVWVASGEYSISTAILLADSVNVYGGFAGTESSVNDRVKSSSKAWDFANTTILKGNGQRLIETKAVFDLETIVDGFTMTGGNGTGSQLTNAGGAIVMRGNTTVKNCIIKGNTATGNGGAVNMTGGTLKDSYIAENTGGAGGAVYSNPATSTPALIYACIIEKNLANGTGGGGAIRAQGTASQTYMGNLLIINNQAKSTVLNAGGALYFNSVNCHISNSVIANNSGSNVIYMNGGEMGNSTVVNNIGGIYCASTTAAINLGNNVVWGCVTTDGTTATGISGTGSAACVVSNNATYTSIPAAYTASNNITLPSNNTNGETDGKMGPDFVKVTTFKGATDDVALIEEIHTANWALKTGSPLIDKGMTIASIPDDIAGTTRPQGSAYDIGAYEYTAGTGIQNNTADNGAIIYTEGKNVYILNANGIKVEIYNITGQLVKSVIAGDQNLTIDQPGIYIVKCGNYAQKIQVAR
ncbi:choice-of-anchor Q domain-containing protein [Bacteroides sedimenti]